MRRKKMIGVVLIVTFLLAAYLRVDFLRSVNHHMPHDSIHYDAMVRQLLETGVYAYKDTFPNAAVTPGYPLFMAAIYWFVEYERNDPLSWVRYIQVVLSLLSIWLIYRIARTVANDIVGAAAAFVAAIYPPFVWANGAILTEVLGTFLLLGYMLAQIGAFRAASWRFALLSGVLLGLAVLVRPEFMPLLAAAYLFYWLWRKDNRRNIAKLFAVSCAGLVLVLLPWWVRNAITLDEWIATATQTNPFTAGTFPYKDYEHDLINPAGMTETEAAVERLKVGFTTQPWLFIKWFTVGKLQYIYQNAYFGGGHDPLYTVIPLINLNALHRFIVLFGLVAVFAALRTWRQMTALLAVTIATLTVIRLGFVPEYRYNVTTMPFIVILDCAVGARLLLWTYDKMRMRLWKPKPLR